MVSLCHSISAESEAQFLLLTLLFPHCAKVVQFDAKLSKYPLHQQDRKTY